LETIFDETEKKEAIELINALFLQENSPLAVNIQTVRVQRSELEVNLDLESLPLIKNLIFENLKGAYRRFINTRAYKEYEYAYGDRSVLVRESEREYDTVDETM
jgi:hypothetical protein